MGSLALSGLVSGTLAALVHLMLTVLLLLPALACEDSNWHGVRCAFAWGAAHVLDFPVGTVATPSVPAFPLYCVPNALTVGCVVGVLCTLLRRRSSMEPPLVGADGRRS